MIGANNLIKSCPSLAKARAINLLRGPGHLEDLPPFPPDLQVPPGPALILWLADLLTFEKVADPDKLHALLDFFAPELAVVAETLNGPGDLPIYRLAISDLGCVNLTGFQKTFNLEVSEAVFHETKNDELKIVLYNITSLFRQRKAMLTHGEETACLPRVEGVPGAV